MYVYRKRSNIEKALYEAFEKMYEKPSYAPPDSPLFLIQKIVEEAKELEQKHQRELSSKDGKIAELERTLVESQERCARLANERNRSARQLRKAKKALK